MSGFSFDANIVIDALLGYQPAHDVLRRASSGGAHVWVSRVVWIEVMSKGDPELLRDTERFLSGFSVDEIDGTIAARAAALRRDRPRFKSPDAIILATAMVRGRILVTRNTRDFPATMPGIRIPYTI